MQELIQFVSTSIAGGAVGNFAYDGLKAILGSSFDRLSIYLSNNQIAKFEGALEILIEQNEELKKQIDQLQKGEEITSTTINQTHTGAGDNVGGDKIVNSGISIDGSNFGSIVTGNNNTVGK